MNASRELADDDGGFEVPFAAQYTDGLNHKVGDRTVQDIYRDSYGEKGQGWFLRFKKVALGGAAIVAIVITAEGIRHFHNKYPDESID